MPGLSETFIRDEMRHFRSRGHTVHLVCQKPLKSGTAPLVGNDFYDALWLTGPQGRVQKVTAKLDQTYRRVLGSPAAHGARAMARYINSLSTAPDAMIAHFGPNVVLAAHVKRALDHKVPLVGVFHGFDLSLHVRKHSSAAYLRHAADIDLFVAISAHGKRALQSFGIPDTKITSIHLGVNHHVIPAQAKATPTDGFRIVSVGRMVEKKGFDTLIDALAMLPPQVLARSSLTIIGDGPLRRQLHALAEERGVGTNVNFAGALPHQETLQQISDSSLFVLASRTSKEGDMEGIPVVLMEAMAASTPVVATKHAGIPELIDDGVSGLLVPENDPHALAAAIQRIVDDAEGTKTRIQTAQERVRRDFNRERQNRILEDEISALVAKQSASAMT